MASRERRERDRHLPGYPSKQVHSQRPRAVDAASPSHRGGVTARTSAASRACWWRDGRASSRLPQRRLERLVPPVSPHWFGRMLGCLSRLGRALDGALHTPPASFRSGRDGQPMCIVVASDLRVGSGRARGSRAGRRVGWQARPHRREAAARDDATISRLVSSAGSLCGERESPLLADRWTCETPLLTSFVGGG